MEETKERSRPESHHHKTNELLDMPRMRNIYMPLLNFYAHYPLNIYFIWNIIFQKRHHFHYKKHFIITMIHPLLFFCLMYVQKQNANVKRCSKAVCWICYNSLNILVKYGVRAFFTFFNVLLSVMLLLLDKLSEVAH